MQTIERLLENSPDFFCTFNCVIVAQAKEDSVKEESIRALAASLQAHNVPLIIVRTYGLIGYVRIAVAEHTGEHLCSRIVAELRICAMCTVFMFDFSG